MFPDFLSIAPPQRSIVLQTKTGREVPNAITGEPEYQQILKHGRLQKRHPRWEERRPPVGGYNCLGHVWASRRTGIYDEVERQIGHVFADDGYRVVATQDEVKQGDLIAYWIEIGGVQTFLHAGIVLQCIKGTGGLSAFNFRILSKLDATSAEFIHDHRDVELPGGYTFEFWTDRPIAHT